MGRFSGPTHMVRQHCSFYFRMVIPADLRDLFEKSELRYSLKTDSIKKARSKAKIISGHVQTLFDKIREDGGHMGNGKKLTKAIIDEILKGYVHDALDENEDYLARRKPISYNDIDLESSGISAIHTEYKEALVRSDYRRIRGQADDLLESNGITFDRASVIYNRFCREMMIKHLQFLEILDKRTTGNYESITEAVTVEPEQTSATLKEAAEDYWDEYSENRNERSNIDYRLVLDHVVKEIGPETQIHMIDFEKLRQFRDDLKSGKISKSGNPLSPDRVNFHLEVMKNIYNLAMKKDKKLDRINPAEGLRLRDKRRADSKRMTFTVEDLEKIFCKSKEYSRDMHKHPLNFWLPLIGLFTGARLEEICQLLLTNVVKRDGIWCLDIREDDAPDMKSIKTGERRIIPLHPFLVKELNFPGYVQSVKKSDIRVFPNLKRTKQRWGHGAGQWFAKFKARCGIEAPPRMKVFHSFRHTVINHLKQNNVDSMYVKEFVGHKGGDLTWDLYGKEFEPEKIMDKVVSKLNFHEIIDLSHLKKSKYVVK